MPGAILTYEVREGSDDSSRPLFIFASPMAASGFSGLISYFDDRTVILYDPRAAERSELASGSEVTTEIHADDLHRVVAATRLGLVEAFGSSGGAQNALAWIVDHPEDVFPGDHPGFTVNPMSPNNNPSAFAARLREVLDGE